MKLFSILVLTILLTAATSSGFTTVQMKQISGSRFEKVVEHLLLDREMIINPTHDDLSSLKTSTIHSLPPLSDTDMDLASLKRTTPNTIAGKISELVQARNARSVNLDEYELEEFSIDDIKAKFAAIRHKIAEIKLAIVNSPILVPIINLTNVVVSILPCAMAVKDCVPHLVRFLAAAQDGLADQAVENLIDMLQALPDVTEKCIKKTFTIPKKVMDHIECGVDIAALAATVGKFIIDPMNIIADIDRLRKLFKLVPKTIAVCTGTHEE